jgi:hypothetical protein
LIRQLFHDLTGDAAVSPNAISNELEERLRWMLALQDPNITVDLRINNGFKGTKFNEFWDELDAYFNEVRIFYKILLNLNNNFIRFILKIILYLEYTSS